ncbi:uncharacterized protein LOC135926443 [Gordionus sp. m RMFG-2023]|uniref:uncharacterized protein LOC135926443 n=1 Tax=Gordionus sp. m RMFG-2023 TaxID=3053472 RepID=UPI0031FC2908
MDSNLCYKDWYNLFQEFKNTQPSLTSSQEKSLWHQVHIDNAGPYQNHYWLVVIDASSHWPEIVPMTSTTTESTIKILRNIFARFGFTKIIVSDNGPQFSSKDFNNFHKKNGIQLVHGSPYHPQTNGITERLVRTFKQSMNKRNERDLETSLSRLYNNKEKKWEEAIIKGILGSQRYEVSIAGNMIIRHTDTLGKRTENILIEEYQLKERTEVEEKTEELVNKEDAIKNNDEMN